MKIEGGKYWQRPWSLVDGCTPCSPGCLHCWSAAMTHRFDQSFTPLTDIHGKFLGKVVTRPDRLDIPLKRRKPTVYSVWNDWLHESVPFEFIAQILDVACDARCEEHTILLLTKRPHRWSDFKWWHGEHWPGDTPFSVAYEALGHLPENVYSGLTVCNQQEADEKIPIFLQVPGKKFLSIEPMLSAIDITEAIEDGIPTQAEMIGTRGLHYIRHGVPRIHAVILGGETGSGARPMHPDWVRSVRDQCAAAGVPFFFKGWGTGSYEWRKDYRPERDCDWRKKLRGRLLDGQTHDALPWRKII